MSKKEIPIDNAPFLKSLLKRTKKLYFTKSGKIRRKYNPKDTYQRDILEICLRINSLFETLRLSRFFLGERVDIPVDNDLKIKNADFIRYHIECYFIRITTFKDLILKLYNRVYRFEIKENIGLEGNLKKKAVNENISDLIHLLEGLSILMREIEPVRNRITHGGYYDGSDLILIESEETVRKDTERKSLTDDEYNSTLKRFLEKNILEMQLIEMMKATYLLMAYKTLYPVRKAKENELGLKTKKTIDA